MDWSENGIGRCASCISKLGALSRSSTTTANTPGAPHAFSSPWYMDANSAGKKIVTECLKHFFGGMVLR